MLANIIADPMRSPPNKLDFVRGNSMDIVDVYIYI